MKWRLFFLPLLVILTMAASTQAHEFPPPPEGFVHIRKKEDNGNFTDHFIRSDQVVALTIFQQSNGHILSVFTSIMKNDEIPMSIRLWFKDHESAAKASARIFATLGANRGKVQAGD